MNKKGTDKILAVYWFVILILVAGGIFLMVYVFYDNSIDIREAEADILATKVADCLSIKGSLAEGVLSSDSETGEMGISEVFENNFLKMCHLTFAVEDEKGFRDGSEYYIQLDFFNIGGQKISGFSVGEPTLDANCEILNKKGESYKNPAKCVSRGLYVVGENNVQFLVRLLVVVDKGEKNV